LSGTLTLTTDDLMSHSLFFHYCKLIDLAHAVDIMHHTVFRTVVSVSVGVRILLASLPADSAVRHNRKRMRLKKVT
jgi:hypothetical protein